MPRKRRNELSCTSSPDLSSKFNYPILSSVREKMAQCPGWVTGQVQTGKYVWKSRVGLDLEHFFFCSNAFVNSCVSIGLQK